MWKQWKGWLPEVVFIILILGISFWGAIHSFVTQ